MENTTPPTPLSTQDERILAALAHISAILPMMGVIAPIIIWTTQKERSPYVAFQALQATAFQLLQILIWFGGMACYMGSFFLTFFGTFASSGSNAPGSFVGFFFLPFIVMFGMMFLMLIMVVYALVAAVLTFQGKDFRYALLGQWVERYRQKPSGIPS